MTGQFRVASTNPESYGERYNVFSINSTGTANSNGANDDYDLTGGALTIDPNGNIFFQDPGGIQRNVNVLPFDDDIDEDDETVIITLTGTSNPTLFPIDPDNNTATVTIIDNDTAGVTVDTTTGTTY